MENPYAAPDPDSRSEPTDTALPDSDQAQPSSVLTDEARALFETESRIRNGASWFFWIAAASVINSVTLYSGSDWGFAIGLGITQIIDGIAIGIGQEVPEAETVIKVVAFGLGLVAVAIVIGIGILARKGLAWAFILGMMLYALDGLIFLLAEDMLGVGLHVFALLFIWNGLKALRQRQQLESTAAASMLAVDVVE